MQDAWFRFVLTLLATWRVTHLLAYEDGPWDVLVRLRAALGNRALGRLFDCFQCVSMWVAAAFGLFVSRGPLLEWGVVWLALSGGACLLERLGRDSVVIQRLETKGDDDALLRRQAGGDAATEERPAEPGSHEFEAGPLRAVR